MCHKVALLELFHFEAVGAVLSKRVSSLFKILGVVFTPFFSLCHAAKARARRAKKAARGRLFEILPARQNLLSPRESRLITKGSFKEPNSFAAGVSLTFSF